MYTEEQLQNLKYNEITNLAKTFGVFKNRTKKVKLIRKLLDLWEREPISGGADENTDPSLDHSRRDTFIIKSPGDVKTMVAVSTHKRDRLSPQLRCGSSVSDSATSTTVNEDIKTPKENTEISKVSAIHHKTPSTGSPRMLRSSVDRRGTFYISSKTDSSLEVSDSRLNGSVSETQNIRRETFSKPLPGNNDFQLKRQNTFTKSCIEDKDSTTVVNDNFVLKAKSPKCSPTFNSKTIRADDLPLFKPEKTPPKPISRLSVFERLSAKLPLSERRSIVNKRHHDTISTPVIDRRPNTHREKRITSTSNIIKKKHYVTPRKMPDFKKIHSKSFAKMESIADVKRNMTDRANVLFSPVSFKSGVKVRMSAAEQSKIPIFAKSREQRELMKNSIITKGPVNRPSVLEKKNETLKGVRMNKRFQLQIESLKKKK